MIDTGCMSYYCALRYLPFPDMEWIPGCGPLLPADLSAKQISVGSCDEVIDVIRDMVEVAVKENPTGILLSGGIDSAIVAAFLPPGSKAYTIDFEAETAAPEAERAQRYAEARQLDWQVVKVNWQDYLDYEPHLMKQKKAPLHAVEVALHKAALQARRDGLDCLLVGNGADSTFGGMDKLLSRDWTFDDFVKRYTFIQPATVLREPADTTPAFELYRNGEHIDFIGFLKKIHGTGIIQSFNNSVASTGIRLVEPFEHCKLKGELDLDRIRRGEPKYILFDVFARLYPELAGPAKVPFARPMDEWLADYAGPVHHTFLPNLSMKDFTGNQKYLIRCLDRFVNMIEEGQLCQ